MTQSITGRFVILLHGKLYEYVRFEDLPETFDNLISFAPDYPPEPHTEQHAFIATFNDRLRELRERETR